MTDTRPSYAVGFICPGDIRIESMKSILRLHGLGVPVVARSAPPYLDRERNLLFAMFLNDPITFTCDVLLNVDADIEFTVEDAARVTSMCTPQTPVVSGVYANVFQEGLRTLTYRRDKFEQPDGSPWGYHAYTYQELCDLPANPDGLVNVDAVGFGFVAIHRSLLNLMGGVWAVAPWCYETIVEGVLIGEDYSFCERVAACGFPILVAPDVTLGHMKTLEITPTSIAGLPITPPPAVTPIPSTVVGVSP